MKFIYFGYDFMLGSIHRLLEEGHELTGVFTFECDNIFNFNQQTYKLAEEHSVPISESPPTAPEIGNFVKQGTEVFLSAGYPYKIPPIDGDNVYGLNFHPSLLPMGRGIMPTPYIIMDYPNAAGATLHKMEERFDTGDILMQRAFPISPQETVETYSARIAMAASDMLVDTFSNIKEYWKNAKAQDEKEALHFPVPTDDMRILKWDEGIEHVDRTARAFGRYGSIAQIGADTLVVYDHDVWPDEHEYAPGQIACQMSREIIVTASDGYVCLKEFQILENLN